MYKALCFLRSVLFYFGYGLSMLIGTLLCFLLVLVLPENRYHVLYQTWCRFMLLWLRICCGIRYQVSGLEHITDQPVVVLSNHQSEWETAFIYKYLAPICPILKKELLSIPVYGWAMRLLKPIAIDRSKPREAGRAILSQGTARLHSGRSVIIFPEGTRAPAGTVNSFSRGGAKLAIAAGVPVLPFAHNAGACWPARRFIKFPGTINAWIGKPVITAGREAGEVTDEVESWVRQHVVG